MVVLMLKCLKLKTPLYWREANKIDFYTSFFNHSHVTFGNLQLDKAIRCQFACFPSYFPKTKDDKLVLELLEKKV